MNRNKIYPHKNEITERKKSQETKRNWWCTAVTMIATTRNNQQIEVELGFRPKLFLNLFDSSQRFIPILNSDSNQRYYKIKMQWLVKSVAVIILFRTLIIYLMAVNTIEKRAHHLYLSISQVNSITFD